MRWAINAINPALLSDKTKKIVKIRKMKKISPNLRSCEEI